MGDLAHVGRREGPGIAVDVVVEELGQVLGRRQVILAVLDVERVDQVDGGDDRQVGVGVKVHWHPPPGWNAVRPLLAPYPFRQPEATANPRVA